MTPCKTLTAAAGVLLLMGASQAQEPRYQRWQGAQAGDKQELLNDLRALIDQAERSRAADPALLRDLRNLAEKHAGAQSSGEISQWPARLLSDSFRDGDFTRNPAWKVSAGNWRVTTERRVTALESTVHKPVSRPDASGADPGREMIMGAIGTILSQQQGGQRQQQEQPAATDEFAAITAPVRISNPFHIRLEIAAQGEANRFEFGPYKGQRGGDSYQVTYMPGADGGLMLSRVTSRGTQQLAKSAGGVELTGDKPHVIDWQRDRDGRMTVTVDGKPAIAATDTAIRDSFDGFVMVNGGGTYRVSSVAINGVK